MVNVYIWYGVEQNYTNFGCHLSVFCLNIQNQSAAGNVIQLNKNKPYEMQHFPDITGFSLCKNSYFSNKVGVNVLSDNNNITMVTAFASEESYITLVLHIEF